MRHNPWQVRQGCPCPHTVAGVQLRDHLVPGFTYIPRYQSRATFERSPPIERVEGGGTTKETFMSRKWAHKHTHTYILGGGPTKMAATPWKPPFSWGSLKRSSGREGQGIWENGHVLNILLLSGKLCFNFMKRKSSGEFLALLVKNYRWPSFIITTRPIAVATGRGFWRGVKIEAEYVL